MYVHTKGLFWLCTMIGLEGEVSGVEARCDVHTVTYYRLTSQWLRYTSFYTIILIVSSKIVIQTSLELLLTVGTVCKFSLLLLPAP